MKNARFNGHKLGNEYAAMLGDLYNAMPKAVLGAIVASYASTGGDWPENVERNVLTEWWALYNAGIVPQKPNKPIPA